MTSGTPGGLDEPLQTLDGAALRGIVTTFGDALIAHREAIDRLNVYPVPDGDTGTNMARTLAAVVDELGAAPDDAALDIGSVCDAIAHGSLIGARGNSGVILSQILRGLSEVLRRAPLITGAAVAEALAAGSVAADGAVLTPVEGTMLTVSRESAAAAVSAAAAGGPLALVLRSARDEGRASLARTPELLPVLREAGVVDAGGAGFLLLLDAALHVVAGDPLPTPSVAHGAGVTATPCAPVCDLGDMRYEVMFLVDLPEPRIADLKAQWGLLGSSVVVVGGDGRWNCHVHTNDIGPAIEAVLDLHGRPRRIRVTDLREERSQWNP